MGFSADFSSAGRRVLSAQRFSEAEGWRLSAISESGLSGTCVFLSAMIYFDDRRVMSGGARRESDQVVGLQTLQFMARRRSRLLLYTQGSDVACNRSLLGSCCSTAHLPAL